MVDFSNLKKTVRQISKEGKKIVGIVYSVGCAQKIQKYLKKYKYNVLIICSEQHKDYDFTKNTGTD
jgi:hypothetical protein